MNIITVLTIFNIEKKEIFIYEKTNMLVLIVSSQIWDLNNLLYQSLK